MPVAAFDPPGWNERAIDPLRSLPYLEMIKVLLMLANAGPKPISDLFSDIVRFADRFNQP